MGRLRVIGARRAAAPEITPWDSKRLCCRRPHGDALKRADEKLPSFGPREKAAYERYLLSCSDYLKRQMIVYQHWPQRRYDVLGYRDEKVFTDMNN